MAFRHYTLTLDGTVQRLSDVLGGIAGALPDADVDLPFRQLILAADPANTAVVYIGSASDISATDHGFSLDPTQATAKDRESLGPFESGPIKLSQIYVLGTASQRLMVAGVPF